MYNFITKRHVKIWLGPLTLQNELRLRNLRAINPDCDLFLIYDSRILSASEDGFVQVLCKELHIKVLNVVQDILPHCTTAMELNLTNDYHQAIQPTEQGGNLAAASDILRWLSPVYTLGTYSDMDVLIDASRLPRVIDVSRPLLFNFGSLNSCDTEYLVVNNDIVAVVDPVSAGPLIKKIQKAIHNGCRHYSVDEDPFSVIQEQFNSLPRHPNSSAPGFSMSSPLSINPDLVTIAKGKSIAQTRAEIIRITANSTNYCEYYPWKCLFYSMNPLSSDSSLNSKIKEHRYALLGDSVIYTSGPGATLIAFSEYRCYPGDYFMKEKVPYALEHYGLDQHFQTRNGLPLHSGIMALYRMGGKTNDLSWLEEGRKAIKDHENAVSKLSSYINVSFESCIDPIENGEIGASRMIIPPHMAAELGKLAQLHMKQLADVQHQFRMSTPCNQERFISFASCLNSNSTTLCVQTNVRFQPASFFAKGQNFPGNTEYRCRRLPTSGARLVCSTELTQELCDVDSIPTTVLDHNLVSTLAASATYSALAAAIPEAVGDALRLIGNVSESRAYYATQATNLIFIVLMGSWLSVFIAMIVELAAGLIGVSKPSARLLGNVAAHTASIAQNPAPATLLAMGGSLVAGKFGLWAEKKIVKQFEGLLSMEQLGMSQ